MCNRHDDPANRPEATRRDVLRVGATAAVAALGGMAWAADLPKPGEAPPPNAIAPADAVKHLLAHLR